MNSYYCSRQHQKADWKTRHGDYCKNVQLVPRGGVCFNDQTKCALCSQTTGFSSLIPSRDIAFLSVKIRQVVLNNKEKIEETMKCHDVNTVDLMINFWKIPETLEVGYTDSSSPKVPQLIGDKVGDAAMQRLSQILMKVSQSPGSASIAVTIPRGIFNPVLIGSMDMQKPVTIQLEQFG